VEATFWNSIGYLPDGTPMNAAGNAINHPENIGADSPIRHTHPRSGCAHLPPQAHTRPLLHGLHIARFGL
jgi:hypothetical protein